MGFKTILIVESLILIKLATCKICKDPSKDSSYVAASNGKAYHFQPNKVTGPEAVEYCKKDGGLLAMFKTEEDLQIAMGFVDSNTWIGILNPTKSSCTSWESCEGLIKWSDGTDMTREDHIPMTPEAFESKRGCIVLKGEVPAKISDRTCTKVYPVLCEYCLEGKAGTNYTDPGNDNTSQTDQGSVTMKPKPENNESITNEMEPNRITPQDSTKSKGRVTLPSTSPPITSELVSCKDPTENPDYVTESNGKVYHYHSGKVTGPEAVSYCENDGGLLATFKTREDFEVVLDYATKNMWIGLLNPTRDLCHNWETCEDLIKWSDGTDLKREDHIPLTEESFQTNKGCVILRSEVPTKLSDRPCTKRHPFLCEYCLKDHEVSAKRMTTSTMATPTKSAEINLAKEEVDVLNEDDKPISASSTKSQSITSVDFRHTATALSTVKIEDVSNTDKQEPDITTEETDIKTAGIDIKSTATTETNVETTTILSSEHKIIKVTENQISAKTTDVTSKPGTPTTQGQVKPKEVFTDERNNLSLNSAASPKTIGMEATKMPKSSTTNLQGIAKTTREQVINKEDNMVTQKSGDSLLTKASNTTTLTDKPGPSTMQVPLDTNKVGEISIAATVASAGLISDKKAPTALDRAFFKEGESDTTLGPTSSVFIKNEADTHTDQTLVQARVTSVQTANDSGLAKKNLTNEEKAASSSLPTVFDTKDDEINHLYTEAPITTKGDSTKEQNVTIGTADPRVTIPGQTEDSKTKVPEMTTKVTDESTPKTITENQGVKTKGNGPVNAVMTTLTLKDSEMDNDREDPTTEVTTYLHTSKKSLVTEEKRENTITMPTTIGETVGSTPQGRKQFSAAFTTATTGLDINPGTEKSENISTSHINVTSHPEIETIKVKDQTPSWPKGFIREHEKHVTNATTMATTKRTTIMKMLTEAKKKTRNMDMTSVTSASSNLTETPVTTPAAPTVTTSTTGMDVSTTNPKIGNANWSEDYDMPLFLKMLLC